MREIVATGTYCSGIGKKGKGGAVAGKATYAEIEEQWIKGLMQASVSAAVGGPGKARKKGSKMVIEKVRLPRIEEEVKEVRQRRDAIKHDVSPARSKSPISKK